MVTCLFTTYLFPAIDPLPLSVSCSRCLSSPLYPVALNNHGTLPVAPFVSMLRASFVHGFRSGPSANEEKLVTGAGYAPGPVDSHVENNQNKGAKNERFQNQYRS